MNTARPFLLLALLTLGCSGTWSQTSARDAATAKTCDYYSKCAEIGSGKKYATRDACEVDVRSYWNNAWPLDECDNKIRNEDMDVCLKAIEITVCGNSFDFFNTIFNKCGKSSVCKGP